MSDHPVPGPSRISERAGEDVLLDVILEHEVGDEDEIDDGSSTLDRVIRSEIAHFLQPTRMVSNLDSYKKCMRDIVNALHIMHENGYFHGNINPDTTLFASSGKSEYGVILDLDDGWNIKKGPVYSLDTHKERMMNFPMGHDSESEDESSEDAEDSPVNEYQESDFESD